MIVLPGCSTSIEGVSVGRGMGVSRALCFVWHWGLPSLGWWGAPHTRTAWLGHCSMGDCYDHFLWGKRDGKLG